MSPSSIEAFAERLDDRIEAKYQEFLKDKLDLIFNGPNGDEVPNKMTHKMRTTLTKKWKTQKITTRKKLELKKKIRQKETEWPVKILSDFHGGYAIVCIMYNFKKWEFNIIDEDGNFQLRTNTNVKPEILQGHFIMNTNTGRYLFDERHDGEEGLGTKIESDFFEGYARTTEYYGENFITDDGTYLLKTDIHSANFSDFHEGFVRLGYSGAIDYMDYKGNLMFGELDTRIVGIDYDRVTVWKGNSPFEEGGDFHDGYARVKTKRDGKWNLIDYQGKEVFKEGFDEISDVEFGRVQVKKDHREYSIYLGMGNHRVEKIGKEYECISNHESYRIKYQPVRDYGSRFVLCTDRKDYYMFDKHLKEYRPLGPVDSFIYDDYFLYNVEEEKMYLVYEEVIVDITEYYNENIKGQENIRISKGVSGLLSREIFESKRMDEIDKIIAEERQANVRILTEQRADKERKDLENARLTAEEQERQRLENLKQAIYDLKDAIERVKKYSVPGKPPIRVMMELPMEVVGDHLEIPQEIWPALKYIDLSHYTFENVKVEGMDFSDCNLAIFNPQLVYGKSLKNCKFERIDINPFTNFEGVDIRGCTFSTDHTNLTIDIFNSSLEHAIYDETTTYDGMPLAIVIAGSKKDEQPEDPGAPKM